jgi:integrase
MMLTADEVDRLLDKIDGLPLLVSELPYGSGMRLVECLRGRVKDTTMISAHVLNRGGRGVQSPESRARWTEDAASSCDRPIWAMMGGPDSARLSRLAGDEAVRGKSLRHSDLWGAGARVRHEDRRRGLVSLSWSDAQSAAHARPARIGRSNGVDRARIG